MCFALNQPDIRQPKYNSEILGRYAEWFRGGDACWNKAAEVLQAEAGSYHDQNTAEVIAEGRADVLGITDVVEVGQVHN
jgi:hypothetical protein